jgi:hypothetical protein
MNLRTGLTAALLALASAAVWAQAPEPMPHPARQAGRADPGPTQIAPAARKAHRSSHGAKSMAQATTKAGSEGRINAPQRKHPKKKHKRGAKTGTRHALHGKHPVPHAGSAHARPAAH